MKPDFPHPQTKIDEFAAGWIGWRTLDGHQCYMHRLQRIRTLIERLPDGVQHWIIESNLGETRVSEPEWWRVVKELGR